jgi:hypothetical protein
MKIRRDPSSVGSLLIIGGAGGVGSIATQLARRLTGLLSLRPPRVPKRRRGVAKWARIT